MQVEDGLARLGVMSLVDGKAIKSTEANNSVTLRGSARGTPRSSVLGRAVASLEDYQNPVRPHASLPMRCRVMHLQLLIPHPNS